MLYTQTPRHSTHLLQLLQATPRHTRRKGSNVLYLKASEQIEDLLTFMGASGAALEIMHMKVYKDFRNKANRITNCETANITKTVTAAARQVDDILFLQQKLSRIGESYIDTAVLLSGN